MATVVLAKELGRNLTTRNSLRSLFEKAAKSEDETLVVDFKNIEFISRSCADEYLKLKESLLHDKKIIEQNKSKDLEQMFSIVQQSRTMHLEQFKPTPVFSM